MDTDERDQVLASATQIVQETLQTGTAQLSAADVATLVAVTVRDIVQVCHQDETRLTKLESQTHGLAEAVLAMNEAAASVAPAVEAVKAEMAGEKE